MSEKVPEGIVNELKKAAKSRDATTFGKAINKHKRDLPEDLLEAAEDKEILEETMDLFNTDLADVYEEGVRLRTEDTCGSESERRRRH